MRKKFQIKYPVSHPDPEKAGKVYKPESGKMIVMNRFGVFFELSDGEYYGWSFRRLSDVIGNYDVIWDS